METVVTVVITLSIGFILGILVLKYGLHLVLLEDNLEYQIKELEKKNEAYSPLEKIKIFNPLLEKSFGDMDNTLHRITSEIYSQHITDDTLRKNYEIVHSITIVLRDYKSFQNYQIMNTDILRKYSEDIDLIRFVGRYTQKDYTHTIYHFLFTTVERKKHSGSLFLYYRKFK